MTTRAELLATTLRWLRRESDTELVAALPGLLRLVEARIARELTHSSQSVTTTLAVVDGAAELPADCLEARSITVTGTRRRLDRVGSSVLRESPAWSSSGPPRYYAIEGRSVVIAPPAATATLDLVYWARFPALVADSDTNAVLTAHFDLYLHGLRAETANFIQDIAQYQMANAAFVDTLRALRDQDDAFTSSGSAPRRLGSGFTV